MPIIVDEVVLTVDVVGEPGADPEGTAAPRAPGDRQDLVNECVERVLEILAQREER